MEKQSLSETRRENEVLRREIALLRRRLKTLCWDESFGMLNSSGLSEELRLLDRSNTYSLAYLDLNCLHHLNNLYGYDEVNRRIKEAFRFPGRNRCTVGRVFSGDEILLVHRGSSSEDQLRQTLHNLTRHAMQYKISFMSVVRTCTPNCNMKQVIVEMGQQLLDKKAAAVRTSNRVMVRL